MYTCLCFAVSDRTIKSIVEQRQLNTLQDLQKHCDAGKGCGSCQCQIKELIDSFQQKIQTNKTSSLDPNRVD